PSSGRPSSLTQPLRRSRHGTASPAACMADDARERLAFVETLGQWEALSTWEEFGPSVRVVAVTPEVDLACEDAGIPYETVEDLVEERRLVEAGDANIDRAEALCDDYDRLLADLGGNALVSARAYFHTLKGFLDALTVRAAPVCASLVERPPDAVVCFGDGPY